MFILGFVVCVVDEEKLEILVSDVKVLLYSVFVATYSS